MLGREYFLLLAFYVTGYVTRGIDDFGIQTRIISGTPAVSGQFPWQVLLKKDVVDDVLCGGSCIAEDWVLTAAHCVYQRNSIYLMFGTIYLDDSNAVTMTSTEMFVHPQYNNENLNNDVGLIKLPSSLTFTNMIQPIALIPAAQSGRSLIGATAIIAGFGLTDDDYLEYPQTLLFAHVVVIDNSKCELIFGSDVVISSTLCAEGAKGSIMSICSGDSGGPLIVQNANGQFIQIGINSFVAQEMCTKGYPSGYARLTSFLDFISETTGIGFS